MGQAISPAKGEFQGGSRPPWRPWIWPPESGGAVASGDHLAARRAPIGQGVSALDWLAQDVSNDAADVLVRVGPQRRELAP